MYQYFGDYKRFFYGIVKEFTDKQTEKLGKIRNEFIMTVLETSMDKSLDDYLSPLSNWWYYISAVNIITKLLKDQLTEHCGEKSTYVATKSLDLMIYNQLIKHYGESEFYIHFRH